MSFSVAALSACASSLIHCWRACRLSLLSRPEAACSTAPRIAPGIADQPEIDVAILADGAVIHVDLHQLEILADALAVAHAKIERRADDHQYVGLGKRLRARTVEVVRIARRQQPAARAVEITGNIQAAQQRDGLVLAARGPHLLAIENRRPLRVDENVGQLLDVARITDRMRRGAVFAGLAAPPPWRDPPRGRARRAESPDTPVPGRR